MSEANGSRAQKTQYLSAESIKYPRLIPTASGIEVAKSNSAAISASGNEVPSAFTKRQRIEKVPAYEF